MRDNFTEGGPMFVEPEKMDFRLRPNSPAFEVGFKQIPMERIRLYEDDYRRSLPE